MARTVGNIRWHSEAVRDLLRDQIPEPKTSGQKAKFLGVYIQHTRERCLVLEAELDEWRDKMTEWEKEKS